MKVTPRAALWYKARSGIEPSEAAGLVQLRRPRQNRHTLIGIYDAAEAGMEEGGGYATVCELHSTLVIHETRALAEHHASDPFGWCEPCRTCR